MPNNKITTYSSYNEAYVTGCKTLWYSSGRPDMTRLHKIIEEQNFKDDLGRFASIEILRVWREQYGWDAWADILDSESNAIIENDLINQRAIMLKEQATAGKELWKLGLGYLKSEDGGFDSASAAVQAVIRGTELERTARGIGETIEKMSKMSNAELQAEIIKQLQRASVSGQVIHTEEVPNKESEPSQE